MKNALHLASGVELSYLEPEVQEVLYWTMQRLCVFPNLAQARKLKESGREGKLDENGMEIILLMKTGSPGSQAAEKEAERIFSGWLFGGADRGSDLWPLKEVEI